MNQYVQMRLLNAKGKPMTDEHINLRKIYRDCINEIFEYCMERRIDHTAYEVLKIIDKAYNEVLGYDR